MSYNPYGGRYTYGGSLKHYRTKGSRNGYSNDPNYKPVGQKAVGKIINGKYVYDIPSKPVTIARATNVRKPVQKQPTQKQNWFQKGVTNVGNWLGDRGRDVSKAADNVGKSVGKAAKDVKGFITGDSTKEADRNYEIAKINSKYANRAGVQRLKNVDDEGKKNYARAFDNALDKGRSRLNQRANSKNINESLRNKLNDYVNKRDNEIEKSKDGREKTYRRNEYGDKIATAQNESRVGSVEANRKAAQANKEFRKAAADTVKANAKRSVDNASAENEVRINSVEKNRRAAEARKEMENAHDRTLQGIVSNTGKSVDTARKNASKWLENRFGDVRTAADNVGKSVGKAAENIGKSVGKAAKDAGESVGKAANKGLEGAKEFVKTVTGQKAKEEKEEKEQQQNERRASIDTAEKYLTDAKTASEREKGLRELIKAHDSGLTKGINERGDNNQLDTKMGHWLARAKKNLDNIDRLDNNIKKGYYSGKELEQAKQEIAENRIDNELLVGEMYGNKNASGKFGPMYSYENGEKQLDQKNIYPDRVPDNVSKQDWDRYLAKNYGYYPKRDRSAEKRSYAHDGHLHWDREREKLNRTIAK